jgi:catechol 2,3-dioxygenase
MAESEYKIDPGAHIGAVHLTVSDLGRSEEFYVDLLGLTASRDGETVSLSGPDATPLVVLREHPGAKAAPRTTGLFHLAILFPTRDDLARAVLRLAEKRYRLQGSADHLVSEAVYLADPDGNGIEIYRDRPRTEWTFDGPFVQMANEQFDLYALIGELEGQDTTWRGVPAGTTMGHIHLKVADIKKSEAFYHGLLGLDVMLEWGSDAAFLSAGGYHHHVAVNTWSGVGNPPPPAGSTGLTHFEFVLPSSEDVSELAQRLEGAGFFGESWLGGYFVRDPSQIGIHLRSG